MSIYYICFHLTNPLYTYSLDLSFINVFTWPIHSCQSFSSPTLSHLLLVAKPVDKQLKSVLMFIYSILHCFLLKKIWVSLNNVIKKLYSNRVSSNVLIYFIDLRISANVNNIDAWYACADSSIINYIPIL